MMDNFVCRAEKARREYNGFGYAQEELLPGADAVNAKFYRCSLRAGCSVTPELDREKITILIFNGKTGYITKQNLPFLFRISTVFHIRFTR